MPSPFPGMDPYLEQFWGDVHHRLITYACDQLQSSLPDDLRARVEERVYVESPLDGERSIYPDIRVVQRGRRRRRHVASPSGVAVAEPLRIHLPKEPVTEGYIEILDLAANRRVITMIEVLSAANKFAGPGRELYQRKQKECRDGDVNLVEIDLLRAGPWVLAVPQAVHDSYRSTYRVCVLRNSGETGEVYRVPLRERLPIIKIPLRRHDADVHLNLQKLIEQCYLNGGYDEDIDYRAEPVPPLTRDDVRWADALLRDQRRRNGPARKRQAPAVKPRRKRKT